MGLRTRARNRSLFLGLVLAGIAPRAGAQGLPSLVRDINTTTANPGSSSSAGAVRAGNAYFAATTCWRGRELHWSNGVNGVGFVRDVMPGPESSDPDEIVTMGSFVYFVATEPGVGRELWRTDGTAAGTSLVLDIRPGVGSSSPAGLFVAGSRLWFSPRREPCSSPTS